MIGRVAGRVLRASGASLTATLPGARVGDGARVVGARRAVACEIAALDSERVTLTPFASAEGVARGDRVVLDRSALESVVGFGLLGRAVDGCGEPFDDGGALRGSRAVVRRNAPAPFERGELAAPMWTGVRALDALLTCARGARIGIFGAPGCGKSTLLATLLRGLGADATIVAAIGERGREAREWCALLDRRTTVICATSDRSAAERVRGAELALAHGSWLRERGLHVALILDSLTRYANALRELRSSAGEPLGAGGFPPGVWPELAALVERAGAGRAGSLTLFATVLTEADDEHDPLAHAARSLLDGHIVLSSERARAGLFPAIDVPASVSRTMRSCTTQAHREAAAVARAALEAQSSLREFRRAGLVEIDPTTAGLEAALDSFVHESAPSEPHASLSALGELAASLRANR